MHLAILDANIDLVSTMLSLGANSNAKNNNDETPLHFAVEVRFVRGILLLLKHGAELEAEDVEGCTPMDWAMSSDDDDSVGIVRLLLGLGAKMRT